MRDFFISYNKADKEWAKWIAGTLEEYGYSTIIQAWDFKPGNNFILKMQEAVSKCKKIILVLSHSYLNSEYCSAEWSAIFNSDPVGDERKIIPIRIDDVNPYGLLSSIIYIDFVGVEEDVAIKRLLNGVDNSKNPRKKPSFPLSKPNDSSISIFSQTSIVEFAFDLKTNNLIDIPVMTKNKLRKWYFDGQNETFKVSINDKRPQKSCDILEDLDIKIYQQQDLTIEEEDNYEKSIRFLQKCIHECMIKEKAIELFLKDKNLQTYLNMNSHLQLLEFIKAILNYDYFEQKKYSDPQNIMLDIFLTPEPKECNDHFVVCIAKEKIDAIFGGHSLYDIFGAYVADLSQEVRREVAVVFFVFLAEEIIKFKNERIVENRKAMNLLEYSVGVH